MRQVEHIVGAHHESVDPIPSDYNPTQKAVDKHQASARRGL